MGKEDKNNINQVINLQLTGRLIKQKCDYALYICREIKNDIVYMWHTRFYSDGRFMRLTTTDAWGKHCVDWSITVDEEYIVRKGQYSVWLDEKQISSAEQGNKIIVDGENDDYGGTYGFGEFDSQGELSLTLVVGSEGKTEVYTARYIGAVTNKTIVYDENFKDFDNDII